MKVASNHVEVTISRDKELSSFVEAVVRNHTRRCPEKELNPWQSVAQLPRQPRSLSYSCDLKFRRPIFFTTFSSNFYQKMNFDTERATFIRKNIAVFPVRNPGNLLLKTDEFHGNFLSFSLYVDCVNATTPVARVTTDEVIALVIELANPPSP
ncbi:unnamed protein product [Spodoptera exigua]|nr:unnamed protein product [Spodoptera exigua]